MGRDETFWEWSVSGLCEQCGLAKPLSECPFVGGFGKKLGQGLDAFRLGTLLLVLNGEALGGKSLKSFFDDDRLALAGGDESESYQEEPFHLGERYASSSKKEIPEAKSKVLVFPEDSHFSMQLT